MGTVFTQQRISKTPTLLNHNLTMAGLLVFFLPMILVSLANAQCATPCEQCKKFAANEKCITGEPLFDCAGDWELQNPVSSRCTTIDPASGKKVNVCLYKRLSDNEERCFCDPGNAVYTGC